MFALFTEWFSDFLYRFRQPLIYALLIALIFGAGFLSSKNFWQEPLKKEVSELTTQLGKAQEKADNAKKIGDEAKKTSDAQLKEVKKNLDETVAQYQAVKKQKSRIVTKTIEVKVPQKAEPIEVDVDAVGKVICDKFPIEFQDAVNKMIEEEGGSQ